MLAQLQGTFEGLTSNGIIIDVQGIGFEVYVSRETQSRMPSLGSAIKMKTLLLFRQEQPQLFGFFTKQEKDIFELLLTVQGVGPRVALAMLGTYSPSKLLWVLKSEDKKALTSIDGLGPKLASRILNELKDKLEKITSITLGEEDNNFSKEIEPNKIEDSSEIREDSITDSKMDIFREEAVLALEALGYDKSHIFLTISNLCQENKTFDSTQTLIKEALKKLSPVIDKKRGG